MSRTDLLQKLKDRSNAIQTLQASVSFELSGGGLETGEITEYKETTGAVVVQKPGRLHVLVKYFVTIADMVSDGRQFKLSLPQKSEWVTGDSNTPGSNPNRWYNLRPKHILDALFVDVLPYVDNHRIVIKEKADPPPGRHSYYIVEFIDVGSPDAQIAEELWIDRNDMEVAQKIVYAKDGKVESTIEFSDYQNLNGIKFPQVINLHRPIEHYALKMTFQNPVLNGPLAENAFELTQPEGVHVIDLNQASQASGNPAAQNSHE
jgi:hypothetical protein